MNLVMQGKTLAILVLAGSLVSQPSEAQQQTDSTADEAASALGAPSHPYSRWEPGYRSYRWYPPYPEYWSAPRPVYPENPYPPGRWRYLPAPPAEGGYPPGQWYSTPRYPVYGNPYPPGYWQPQQGTPQWEAPYSTPQWEPGYRYRGWESPYPPQIRQGR